MKVAIPMMLYRMSPSERRWKAFVLHLLTTTDDDRATFLGGAVSFPGQ
ncbi:hypothetical protein A176_001644 [Myxococcus hansupus]|uniref:Uncharacterized protein n=2 Tax=Pseudomyxococcus hansupus TaxID=1297742 RepID=A0A0H4XA14_9BACT|nr:hypothetical protein A176_001644 [Myxococcus hansupus]